ncbi:MAG: SfiI family type II restriction endonuclease [Alphaproteobacteria bacterium GM202ARS2]|nr:SfiI family type II restriction endonuclease [Alphaproteobacteria bacterium GM202ARS2]
MNREQLEHVEQIAMGIVVQALTDYRQQILTIFQEEIDQPQDIAEDVTREALDALGVSSIGERLYGKVDYKKAIYAFLPKPQPVALMLDAKSEKINGNRTATIQMSQTSMNVRMKRSGKILDEQGKMDTFIERNGRKLLVVTIIAKYIYDESQQHRELKRIIVACIPNGALQEDYNPNAEDTIWLAGRDAPTLGEDFRVRLSYKKLMSKASWRVKEIALKG